MNKISKMLLSIVVCAQLSLTASPLIIINSMFGPHIFHVSFTNDHTKRVGLEERKIWTYNLQPNESVTSIEWEYYSKDLDKILPYIIDVKTQMPAMAHGGTVVISQNGWFIYDEKKGKVQFGQALVKTDQDFSQFIKS